MFNDFDLSKEQKHYRWTWIGRYRILQNIQKFTNNRLLKCYIIDTKKIMLFNRADLLNLQILKINLMSYSVEVLQTADPLKGISFGNFS